MKNEQALGMKIATWVVVALICIGVVACYQYGQSLTAKATSPASGSTTHTECYQSTAVVPGYSGKTIIHENILYDAHNNILSRQSSLGSC